MTSATRPAGDALPAPEPDARSHSERVVAAIRAEIDASGGWIPFARYMELALYAPGLGYYSAGARKLGRDGDFTTAPELTPAFGHTLARPIGECLASGLEHVLEIGAGSGALAATVLEALERAGRLPGSYQILELSADLRERSRDMLAARVPHLLERVAWLNRAPPAFEGVVIGNEVLDAMPVEIVRITGDGTPAEPGIARMGVGWDAIASRLAWVPRPAEGELRERVAALGPGFGAGAPYTCEIALAAEAFIASLAATLRRGVAIFIDYGFPASEFFHPQRAGGTLMCHYRHRAHDDPFFLPGLQDITAHVDFSAVARIAQAHGLTLAGYTSQASFLIGAGVTGVLGEVSPEDTARYLPLSNAVQKLVSPAEMGEIFKVIVLARDWDAPMAALSLNDRRGAL